MDLYHSVTEKNVTFCLFGAKCQRITAKNEILKRANTENPKYPPEYDLPGNFIFSLLHRGIILTPHHSDFYGQCMANCAEINDFP